MSNEWRIFLEHNDNNPAFDLWSLISNPTSEELREDSYLIATDDVGIKLRGGTSLEIKVRLRRKKRGTEYWVKCLYVPVAAPPTTAAALREILITHNLLNSKYGPYLEQVLKCWEQHPPLRLDCIKRRRQKYIGKLVWEQTEVTLRFNGHELPERFRTICLEGSKAREVADCLEQHQITSHCKQHLVPWLGCKSHTLCQSKKHVSQLGCISMGYPEFVQNIVARLAAADRNCGCVSQQALSM